MSSTWIRTLGVDTHSYPPLEEHISADVAVVGGGLAGVSTAYLLAKAGKHVALVSRGTVAETTTAHTTGFLTTGIDTSLSELSSMFGEKNAKEIWKSGERAIQSTEETIGTENIACDFMHCRLFTFARDDSQWETICKEAAIAEKLGFDVQARRDDALGFANCGYAEIPRQAKFNALKYLRALKAAARAAGARVFDGTEATGIEHKGEMRVVHSKHGSITAADVVIATYYPFTRPLQLFARTGTYTTYIFESTLRKGAFPEALYQDMHNPYHYFRIDAGKGEDRIIAGGEDHREELPMDPEKNYRALLKHMQEILPGNDLKIRERWHWGVIEPLDGLPYIGPLKEDPHQYVITGLSGTGLTMSRVAAEIVADTILGKENTWADLYRANRVPSAKQLLFKSRDYVQEFLGGAARNMFA